MAFSVGHAVDCEAGLLGRSKQGDEEAISQLLSRYEPFIRAKAASFRAGGLETEDLAQEGKIGFVAAVRTYDARKGVLFRTYARQCILNRLLTAARAAARQKHVPSGACISLNDLRNTESAIVTVASPEDVVVRRENIRDIKAAASCFSPLERRVLYFYLSGVPYSAMARELHVGAKAIDNALQRMKRKLSLKLAV